MSELDAQLTMPRLTPTLASDEVDGFHAGTAEALEKCYREHYADVRAAVGRVLQGADAETVVHQVYYRIVSDAAHRARFREGNLAAWLTTVARNEAIDFARRRQRERPLSREIQEDAGAAVAEGEHDAKMLVERFVRERLPEKLRPLFEARFLEQRSQRDAAAALGMQRTTLAYQEHQIRGMLKAFLLEEEEP